MADDLDLDAFLNSSDPAAALAAYDAGGLAGGGGDYATSDYQLASSTAMIPAMKKASIGKAAKLLGAAVAYYGSGALQSLLPALANVLGVQAGDLLVSFLGKKARGRRRRGVTYRQISNARRTYKMVGRLYHTLHKGEHHSSPRRAPPFAHHKKRSR